MKKRVTVAGSFFFLLLAGARVVFPALGGLHENLGLFGMGYKELRKHSDLMALLSVVLLVVVLLLFSSTVILHKRLGGNVQNEGYHLAGPARIEKNVLSQADVEAGLEYCAAAAAKYVPDLIVGVNRGGAIVGGYVARRNHMPFVQLICVGQYEIGGERMIFPDRLLDPRKGVPLQSSATVNILVVDDSHWSGFHMQLTTEWIRREYPDARLRTLVLVNLDVQRPGAQSHTVDDYAFITRDARCKLPWDVSSSTVATLQV